MLVVGVAVEHDLAAVLLVDVADLLAHLALHAVEPRAKPLQLVLEAHDRLDACEIEPELARQPLDEAQALEVGLRVEARPSRRAARPEEPFSFVDAQGLRVHADELGSDGDHVARPLVHQPATFRSSSSSSRSRLLTRLGTSIRTRASTSPFPPPFNFGASRPRIRKSLPGSVPAGTFRETGPSGVGTSTSPPRARVE